MIHLHRGRVAQVFGLLRDDTCTACTPGFFDSASRRLSRFALSVCQCCTDSGFCDSSAKTCLSLSDVLLSLSLPGFPCVSREPGPLAREPVSTAARGTVLPSKPTGQTRQRHLTEHGSLAGCRNHRSASQAHAL